MNMSIKEQLCVFKALYKINICKIYQQAVYFSKRTTTIGRSWQDYKYRKKDINFHMKKYSLCPTLAENGSTTFSCMEAWDAITINRNQNELYYRY